MKADDRDGALGSYLREISKVPLLSAADEVRLGRLVVKGDKQARDQMIHANLRLVVKIAQEYAHFGLPLLDLISEGNIGLMKAVDRFDPERGNKFSTYAAWWIKQGIKRALANQSKTIRLPVHMVDKLARMRRTAAQLTEELGREPTHEELAEELGLTTRKVAMLQRVSQRPSSLNQTIGEENSTELGDLVADENAASPDQIIEEQNLQTAVAGVLHVLDERESFILSLRYPQDGRPPLTLEEIGAQLGVTRERVRQLQNIALRKLKQALEKRDGIRKGGSRVEKCH